MFMNTINLKNYKKEKSKVLKEKRKKDKFI